MAANMNNRYAVVGSDGSLKLKLEGKVEADGVVLLKNGKSWTPVVLGAECVSRGLDANQVRIGRSPRECLAHLGENPGGLRVMTAAEHDEFERTRTARVVEEQQRALEAAIPGVLDLIELERAVKSARDARERQFADMMDDELNDGVSPPAGVDEPAAGRLRRLRAANPRGDLYLRARSQSESGHWSDPTGAAGAGKRCLELLLSGADLDECRIALAVRSESEPWN